MSLWSARFARLCVGASIICFSHAASAETIPVQGVYASRIDVPAQVQLIEVESFGGDLGQDVEFELTDVLAAIRIRGETWFDLATTRALETSFVEVEGNDGTVSTAALIADAVLRGTVRSEAIERRVEDKIERECKKRDDDDKCIEHRQVRIECSELIVRVDPRILLASADGDRLYTYDFSRTHTEKFCEDENSVPSLLDMTNGLIDHIVSDVRADLAPVETLRNIRVMERRRDLRREDRRPFRNAVRATKESIEAACSGFEALEEANPSHVSVLYNIGLCFESGGELERAQDYYSRALQIEPNRDYPKEGLSRVRNRVRAEEFLAERAAL